MVQTMQHNNHPKHVTQQQSQKWVHLKGFILEWPCTQRWSIETLSKQLELQPIHVLTFTSISQHSSAAATAAAATPNHTHSSKEKELSEFEDTIKVMTFSEFVSRAIRDKFCESFAVLVRYWD